MDGQFWERPVLVSSKVKDQGPLREAQVRGLRRKSGRGYVGDIVLIALIEMIVEGVVVIMVAVMW